MAKSESLTGGVSAKNPDRNDPLPNKMTRGATGAKATKVTHSTSLAPNNDPSASMPNAYYPGYRPTRSKPSNAATKDGKLTTRTGRTNTPASKGPAPETPSSARPSSRGGGHTVAPRVAKPSEQQKLEARWHHSQMRHRGAGYATDGDKPTSKTATSRPKKK